MRMRRGRLRHAQLTLLARPPNRRMTSLHSLYARRAHGEFCEHAWEGGGGPRGLLALAGQLQDSAKPS